MLSFNSYRLGTIWGIPVVLDFSVVFLALYMIFQLGGLFEGLVYTVLLLGSILAHELAHTVVGLRFGGRVSCITLQLLGGCASFTRLPAKGWQELLMAAAGPASSLLLGAGLLLGLMVVPDNSFLSLVCWWGMMTNLMLGVFNLLPAFPMDGGRILRAALQFQMSRRRATWWAARIGRYLAIYMMLTGVLGFFGMQISFPVGGIFGFILNILLGGGGLFRALIGWMIFQAAEQEYLMVASDWSSDREPESFFTRWQRRRSQPDPFDEPPPDDEVLVSPPPYDRSGRKRRTDIHRT